VLEHLALADRIAAAFARRYGDLVERDELIQEARLELVRAQGSLEVRQNSASGLVLASQPEPEVL
jgi:hypothetical protein